MGETVPKAASLADIHHDDALPAQRRRWEHLLARFEEQYGRRAHLISRSPGRVNIIGEHIDYSLYEVLPMAVTADVLLAVAVRPRHSSDVDDSQVRFSISNVLSQKYPNRDFSIPSNGDVSIDASSHEWSNYFKAGLKGALSLLKDKRKDQDLIPVSMDILVDGAVPSGGGLSSSAAFVCASALAVLKANGLDAVDQTELVELAVVSERAVGVNSGGLVHTIRRKSDEIPTNILLHRMDQSASVFSKRGSALYVSFKPKLRARAIEFPNTKPELAFLVAQSFVAADKHVSAPVCYNLRVVECSLAAEVLAKKLGMTRSLPKDAGPLEVSLRGFHDTYFEETEGITDNTSTDVATFQKQLERLVQLTEDTLTQTEGYTKEEMATVLGINVERLEERYMSKVPVRAERFLLRQRALHVFSEATRVLKFLSLLSDPPTHSEGLLKDLGAIMNETQKSCCDTYDCSCPELDELCQLALRAGSYGSRLTGAGWGGCSVHLVPQERVDAVRQLWEEEYYRKKFPDISEEMLAEAVVISKPGSGSCVYDVVGTSVNAPILTPINILLFALLTYLAYLKLRPTPPSPPPHHGDAPRVFKPYTPPTLRPYSGHKSPANPDGLVFLAVSGKVYDVTPGRNFYGPSGPYSNFAGRDASRGLACGSFDEDMLTADLEGPLDTLEGLGDDEREALSGWEEQFGGKYLCVGRLVAVRSEEAKAAGL
ncbi:MAG: galactokinase [Piccolia ochrophora]|nr:MAG: galactokinase [Piccolia ochrophora]